MKKTNIFPIIALCALVAGFIAGFITKNFKTLVIINLISCISAFALCIAGIIFASKNNSSKVLSIILLVIGIIGAMAYFILFVGISVLKDPKNTKDFCKEIKKYDSIKCEATDGNISTCRFDGLDGLEIKCYTENLE